MVLNWNRVKKSALLVIFCVIVIVRSNNIKTNNITHDFNNIVSNAQCTDDSCFIYISYPETHDIYRLSKASGEVVSLGLTGVNLLIQGNTLYYSDRCKGYTYDNLYAYSLSEITKPVCIATCQDSLLQFYPVGERFFAYHYLTNPTILDPKEGSAEDLPYEIYLRVTEEDSIGMNITGVEIDEETDCYPVYRTQGTEKTHLFDFCVSDAIHPKVNNYCFFDGDVMYHVSDRDGVYTPLDNTCITRVAPDADGVYRSEILYEGTDSLRLLGVGNGNLYAKRHDGTVLYIIGTDGVCRSEVPLDPNAMCFVGNTDGLLYAVNAEDMTYQTFGES